MSIKSITLGGGCFWCVEAVFDRLQGVQDVVSGYCNGHTPNPSYEAVCTGQTGHVEVVRLRYDSGVISLEEVLQVFFVIHDPTTLNRQGNDEGTQYRSGIYFEDEADRVVRFCRSRTLLRRKIITKTIFSTTPIRAIAPTWLPPKWRNSARPLLLGSSLNAQIFLRP